VTALGFDTDVALRSLPGNIDLPEESNGRPEDSNAQPKDNNDQPETHTQSSPLTPVKKERPAPRDGD